MTTAASSTPATQDLRAELESLVAQQRWGSFLTQARQFLVEFGSAARPLVPWIYRHSVQLLSHDDPISTSDLRRCSVGILRNVAVETWLPWLFAALLERGLVARIWLGDFATVEEYMVNPSSLANQNLDVLWIHLDLAEILGDAQLSPSRPNLQAAADRLLSIGSSLASAVPGHVVISNVFQAPPAVYLPLAAQQPYSGATQVRSINVQLVQQHAGDPRISILDLDGAISAMGRRQAFSSRMMAIARHPFSANFIQTELAPTFASLVVAVLLPPKKCLVVDCDNTLWGGVLAEDGVDGIDLGTEYPGSQFRMFQFFLKGLADRGFLLALCSKNNLRDVLDFMDTSPDMVLRSADFVARRINWRDKPTNLSEISQELNIGLESLVFIDDSDVECALVAAALPAVQVSQFPSDPNAVPDFVERLQGLEKLHVTSDDLTRADSYRALTKTREIRAQALDLDQFIRELSIELTIGYNNHEHIERISQLCLKTNQFNLSTKRHGPSEIEELMNDGFVYTLHMSDRFTDYGLVGVLLLAHGSSAEAEIDTLLLSCRAFGRRIEHAFVDFVIGHLTGNGLSILAAPYVASDKNAMVVDFLGDIGFHLIDSSSQEDRYILDVSAYVPRATGLHVVRWST